MTPQDWVMLAGIVLGVLHGPVTPAFFKWLSNRKAKP